MPNMNTFKYKEIAKSVTRKSSIKSAVIVLKKFYVLLLFSTIFLAYSNCSTTTTTTTYMPNSSRKHSAYHKKHSPQKIYPVHSTKDCNCGEENNTLVDTNPLGREGDLERERTAPVEDDFNEDSFNEDFQAVSNRPEKEKGHYLEGIASWYGKEFDGKKTASGEIFDRRELTAAHKTIPLGTLVNVKNLENEREVVLRVNDRGPYVKKRIVDISEYGAETLGFKQKGLARVVITILGENSSADEGMSRGRREGKGATYAIYDKKRKDNQEENNWVKDESPAYPEHRAIEKESNDPNFFTLQMGVFKTYKHAEKLKKSLSSYGHQIDIYGRDSQYVVKMGKFNTRTEAESIRLYLLGEGYSSFIRSPQANNRQNRSPAARSEGENDDDSIFY